MGAPIKDIFWVAEKNFLVTCSWDKTIKYWDGKSPTPGATLQLPERAYATDVRGELLVTTTADRKVVIVNLNNPQQPHSTIPSPLDRTALEESGGIIGVAASIPSWPVQ